MGLIEPVRTLGERVSSHQAIAAGGTVNYTGSSTNFVGDNQEVIVTNGTYNMNGISDTVGQLVIGDVDANYFTSEQRSWIKDFVTEGGGLVVIVTLIVGEHEGRGGEGENSDQGEGDAEQRDSDPEISGCRPTRREYRRVRF